jgi:hypothetical protein
MFPADEIIIAADAVPLAEHLARQTRQRFRVPASRAWQPIPAAA